MHPNDILDTIPGTIIHGINMNKDTLKNMIIAQSAHASIAYLNKYMIILLGIEYLSVPAAIRYACTISHKPLIIYNRYGHA